MRNYRLFVPISLGLLLVFSSPTISDAAPGVFCDYNGNGACDAADYVVWRDNLGTNNVMPNDPTPTVVDESDYNFWRERFGNSAGSGTAVVVTPEPSTLFLAIAALAGIGMRRRMATA